MSSNAEDTLPPVNRKIRYCSGYKYQLDQSYIVQTSVKPRADIITEWVKLNRDGMLAIMDGYAWDGPSGPTIDTKNFMRGSLVHDALYQLIREGHLDRKHYRDDADQELANICEEDGMSAIRVAWVYAAVRLGGGAAVKKAKPIIEAP